MTAHTPALQADRDFAAPRWLHILLVLVALSELLGGITALPVLAGRWSETPDPGPGGWIIPVYILLRPILAGMALLYLRKDRLQPALYCLAAIAGLEWANMMPSVALNGLQLQDGDAAWRVALVFEIFFKPALVSVTAILAALRTRPVLAGLFALAPTVVGWIGVFAFAVSVAVHGF